MTQEAIIKKVISPGKVEVEVMRGTSCGDACGSCQVCKYASKIRVEASNEICAQLGDRVEIETKSSNIYSAAFLVYIVPFILFFIGYGISSVAGMTEGQSVLMSFAFFAVGMLIAVVGSRIRKKKQEISFRITKIITNGEA